ncbi:WbqC family protein [Streptomyces luteolifulvus]|uniref:WbqC family protein n=1 Tax=Streptomyces luteolifulvus TaxID=2615112 RepID=A0A6H9USI5_9ACTN|nr:WbqC family protein [Streptomyces luteolifulvus]KAB1140764.1 WbqC family protein [Streptomyces luteolifulvus]
MRVTIHQPEHLPWLGLLAKVAASELWIVLDSVPYRKNYFQNRNRVLIDGKPTWVTVPVTAPFGTPISEVRICEVPHWRRRYRGRLCQSVSGLPGAHKVDDLLSSVDAAAHGSSLADLNLDLADWLLAQFDVKVPRIRSSELDARGAKGELIVDLCRAVGADEYLAGPSGRDYLDLEAFTEQGIKVSFFDFEHPVYSQGENDFVPCLSAVDACARLAPEELPPLLAGYRTGAS